MFSDEAFVYADADMVGAVELLQDVNAANSYGPAMLELSGQKGDMDQSDMQAMLLVGALADNLDAVKVPGIVFGFKLKDTSRAVLNMGKLELIAGFGLKQDPRFADCFKRTKVDGHEYLVLTLTGDMVPWDELPLDKLRDVEAEEGSVDKLVAKLKKESLVIAIGLRDDYLLFSIGSSTDVLAKLGQGRSLAQRPRVRAVGRVGRQADRLDRLRQPGDERGGQQQRKEYRRPAGIRRSDAPAGQTGGRPGSPKSARTPSRWPTTSSGCCPSRAPSWPSAS